MPRVARGSQLRGTVSLAAQSVVTGHQVQIRREPRDRGRPLGRRCTTTSRAQQHDCDGDPHARHAAYSIADCGLRIADCGGPTMRRALIIAATLLTTIVLRAADDAGARWWAHVEALAND